MTVPQSSGGSTLVDAESSKMGSSGNKEIDHAYNLAGYIWNVGYIGQEWSDVEVVFQDRKLKLHRIILSKSPYLAELMRGGRPGDTIHLDFNDPNITSEAIDISLQHLYKPSLHLVNSSNSRSVLASSYALQGVPELTHHAYTISRDSINAQNIIDYIQWLGADATPSSPKVNGSSNGVEMMFGSMSMSNGTNTPTSTSGMSEKWSEGTRGRYGEWSNRLRQDVIEYLLHTLPSSLTQASSSSAALPNDQAFIDIYSKLPFNLFKSCIESPDFPIQQTQTRFAFAKKVIALRKKSGVAGQMEEGVVLAVGSIEGSVQITRRSKKSKTALYKTGGIAG